MVMDMIHFLMMVGAFAAWILLFVILWRAMKAHESVAESLKRIADRRE
jgi:hypothetical protein